MTRPFIVSTTLAGNAEGQIGGALVSVMDHVDACVILDTGITDGTLDVARKVAGVKVWVDSALRYEKFDFATARQRAWQVAETVGANWAMTLDTDERMNFGSLNLHRVLENLDRDVDMVLVQQADRTYWKERLFRLPSQLKWRGPTHETLVGSVRSESLIGASFTELAKTQGQLNKKHRRDVELLTPFVQEHPDEARWWYYLGAAHHGLGEYVKAVPNFMHCVNKSVWPEEGAWACFMAAWCWLELGQYEEVLATVARGMVVRPATAELPWLAGVACLNLERYEDAIAWAQMAIANGRDQFPRLSFRDQKGLYEGPWAVLYQAYTALGNDERAGHAEAAWHDAELARRGFEARS